MSLEVLPYIVYRSKTSDFIYYPTADTLPGCNELLWKDSQGFHVGEEELQRLARNGHLEALTQLAPLTDTTLDT